jgi:hypothetical protein
MILAESTGFTALAKMDLFDLAFEAVALRYPESFSGVAASIAPKRLAAAAAAAAPG